VRSSWVLAIPLAATALACSGPPARLQEVDETADATARREAAVVLGTETEGHLVDHEAWTLSDGSRLTQVVDHLWLDGDLLRTEVVERPAITPNGQRFAFAHSQGAEHISMVEACEVGSLCTVLVPDGGPDRVAISDDGVTVVFVASWTGLPSVYAVPFTGGRPTQLTNLGLRQQPGRAPDGFEEPPHLGALSIVDGGVEWRAPDGPHRVELP
jgi:hypothetical protein